MIDFDHTPYITGEKRDLHCQFGDHYYNKKSSPSNKSDVPITKDSEQPSQCKQLQTTKQSSNEQAIPKKIWIKIKSSKNMENWLQCWNTHPKVHTVSRLQDTLRYRYSKQVATAESTRRNVDSFDKHLQRMQQRGRWATHLEIFTAASLLQIPMYIDTQRSKTMVYYWELYNPQSCSSAPCCYLKEHCLLRRIELAHVQSCHYETVNMNDRTQAKHPPRLETSTYHTGIMISYLFLHYILFISNWLLILPQ